MITAVEIENFKGIRDRTRIELKPITLLFGPNSAGKSTLLHALQLAREIFTRRNVDVDVTDGGAGFIDLGGFRNYVHGRDLAKAVTLRFDLDLSTTDFLTVFPLPEHLLSLPNPTEGEFDLSQIGADVESGWIEFAIEWDHFRNRPFVTSYTVGFDGEFLATINTLLEQPDRVELSRLNLWHPLFRWPNGKEFEGTIGLLDALQAGLKNQAQLVYAGGEPVAAHALAGDMEREVIAFAEGSGFPDDRAYRWVHAGDQSGNVFEVTLSRSPSERIIRLHSVHLDPDNYREKEGETHAEYTDRLRLFAQDLLSRQWWLADAEDSSLDIPIPGQVGALPEMNAPLQFQFPQADDDASVENETVAAILNRLLLVPGRVLRAALDELRYVGPVRDAVPRNFEPPRFPDPRRWAGGLAAWDELARNPDGLSAEVTEWLGAEDRLNTGYDIRVKQFREMPTDHPLSLALESGRLVDDTDQDKLQKMLAELPIKSRVTLVALATMKPMQPADVGQGITQAVPVIVAAIHPFGSGDKPRGGLVAVEQPELHLHPAAQLALGDLFVTAAHRLPGHRLLIETHSEHLLLRLLRRIRQTTGGALPPGHPGLKPDRLAVVCFEPPVDGKPARVYRLRVDDQGEFLDPWPRGFFDERAEELFDQ